MNKTAFCFAVGFGALATTHYLVASSWLKIDGADAPPIAALTMSSSYPANTISDVEYVAPAPIPTITYISTAA
jgi:hypothetical protein